MAVISTINTLVRITMNATYDVVVKVMGRDDTANDGTAGNANHFRIDTGIGSSQSNNQLEVKVIAQTTLGSSATPATFAAGLTYAGDLLDNWVNISALPDEYVLFAAQSNNLGSQSWDAASKGNYNLRRDFVQANTFANWAAAFSTMTDLGDNMIDAFLVELSANQRTLQEQAGVEPSGAYNIPKFKYNETSDCLEYTWDEVTYFNLACSLATLQDALDILATVYPTEDYDAGIDPDGFIRVQIGSGGAGTITFDAQFQELLGTYVADFWPPELWYEHVPKWVR